jgi:hypothetical protein
MARSLVGMTLAISCLAWVLPAGLAQAQQAPFPTRPITLIVRPCTAVVGRRENAAIKAQEF